MLTDRDLLRLCVESGERARRSHLRQHPDDTATASHAASVAAYTMYRVLRTCPGANLPEIKAPKM